jgi:hypothetical protein
MNKMNEIVPITINNKLKNNVNEEMLTSNVPLEYFNKINNINIKDSSEIYTTHNKYKEQGIILNTKYLNDKIIPCDKLFNAYFCYHNYNKKIDIFSDKNIYDVYKINDNLIQIKIDNINYPYQNIKLTQG